MIKKDFLDLLKEEYLYSSIRVDECKDDSFGAAYSKGRKSEIENIYCNVLGINILSKSGRSAIRNLNKEMKKSSSYKRLKKESRKEYKKKSRYTWL